MLEWTKWERPGWRTEGREGKLPSGGDPTVDDFEMGGLDQDMWMAIGPSGFTVDIGWYPDEDPDGHYGCRIIQPGDDPTLWFSPVDTFETRSTSEMRAWLERAVIIVERLANGESFRRGGYMDEANLLDPDYAFDMRRLLGVKGVKVKALRCTSEWIGTASKIETPSKEHVELYRTMHVDVLTQETEDRTLRGDEFRFLLKFVDEYDPHSRAQMVEKLGIEDEKLLDKYLNGVLTIPQEVAQKAAMVVRPALAKRMAEQSVESGS